MSSLRKIPYIILNIIATTCFLLSVLLPRRGYALAKEVGAGRRERAIHTTRMAEQDALEEDPFQSYLNWPRLHFNGVFQADTQTVNNELANYNISNFTELNTSPNGTGGWNPNGTGAFRLDRTMVTRICFSDGYCGTEKELDPIIGSSIEEHGLGTSAKMVDLDPDALTVSTIYGLRLRIGGFFSADFHPSPSTYLWSKVENSSEDSGDGAAGATYHTFLKNIQWLKQTSSSHFVRKLRKAVSSSDNGRLSIRLHFDQYQMDSFNADFTWGRVVGAIGVSGSRAPVTTVHGRELEPRVKNRAQTAPFVLDVHTNRVHVDFGNSLPTTSNGSHFLTSIGNLAVGYSTDRVLRSHNCSMFFEWLGLVHYRRPDWYKTTAGIQTFPETYPMSNENMNKLVKTPLVVAEVEGVWPDISCKEILLEEAAHGTLVRPRGEWVFRRDAGEPFSFDLFVTKFGKPLPGAPVQLQMDRSPGSVEEPPLTLPSAPSVTNVNGIVSFTIPTSDPNNPRKIIDGQVYRIQYKSSNQSFGEEFVVHVLIWDMFRINSTPTWVGHVYPIFQLYANLSPVMTKEFIDLGNIDEVIERRKLINMCMTFPFEHPDYMPITRDLSNAKRKMILEWLKQENKSRHMPQSKEVPVNTPVLNRGSPLLHSRPRDAGGFSMVMKHSQETREGKSGKVIPRKSMNTAPGISTNKKLVAQYNFKRTVGKSRDRYYISQVKEPLDKSDNLIKSLSSVKQRLIREKISITKDYKRGKTLSTENKIKHPRESRFTLKQLQRDLQTALEVEHATIPPYLTALSSIKNGYNNQVSHLLKTILVQEMLHMSLVANLLNAVGGKPSLTHPDFVPRYPSLLPGGVHRGLVVPLQNLSRMLIKDVFMKIEEPTLTMKVLDDRRLVMKHMDDYWKGTRSSSFMEDKFYDELYPGGTIKPDANSGNHIVDVHNGKRKGNENKQIPIRIEKKYGGQEGREAFHTTGDKEGVQHEEQEKKQEEQLACISEDDSSLKRGHIKPQSILEEHKNTIGTFYGHILKTLGHLTKCGKDNSIFIGQPSRQLTSEMWYARKSYGHGNIHKVNDYFTAVKAIKEIVEEGEGSSPCMPAAASVDINDLSHYFSFYSIYQGRAIHLRRWNGKGLPDGITDDARKWWEICRSIYTFDGEKIDFDPAGVWPILHNPQMSSYIPWSRPYLLARTFNKAYWKLLNSLELAFNGQPEIIKDAMGLMFSIGINAKRLMRIPIRPGDDPDVGPNAAPTYEPII